MDTNEMSFGDRAEDGPPNVSEEELNELDQKATLEEISRLQQLEVLAVADDATNEEPLCWTLHVFLTGGSEVCGKEDVA